MTRGVASFELCVHCNGIRGGMEGMIGERKAQVNVFYIIFFNNYNGKEIMIIREN